MACRGFENAGSQRGSRVQMVARAACASSAKGTRFLPGLPSARVLRVCCSRGGRCAKGTAVETVGVTSRGAGSRSREQGAGRRVLVPVSISLPALPAPVQQQSVAAVQYNSRVVVQVTIQPLSSRHPAAPARLLGRWAGVHTYMHTHTLARSTVCACACVCVCPSPLGARARAR